MRYLILVCVLAAACKSDNGPTKTPEQIQKDFKDDLAKDLMDVKHRGPGFAIKPDAPAPHSTQPGPAYLWMGDAGLAVIDAGKVTRIESNLVTVIQQLVIGNQGELYLIGGDQVWQLEGTAFKQLSPDDEHMLNEVAAIAPDGTLWVAGFSAVRAWDGKAWKKFDKVYADNQSPSSIAIDGKGRVYIGTKNTILVYDGGAWKLVYDDHEVYTRGGVYAPPEYFRVAISDAGELIATTVTGYAKFADDLAIVGRTIEQKGLSGHVQLAGRDIVAMNYERIVRTPIGTGQDKVIEAPKDAPFSEKAQLDGAGRIWMAPSEGGLTVVGADGKITTFPPGALPELRAQIRELAVAGAGPELPKTSGAIARGSIKGVVTREDKPIAKAEVEVCQSIQREFAKDATPCTRDTRYRQTAKADDAGGFQIDDLPLLDYNVAVKVDGQWYGLQGRACSGLAAGAVCDVGQLEVTNKPIF